MGWSTSKKSNRRTGKEAKHPGSDAEADVIRTERNAEDGHAAHSDANIGDEERIDCREV